MTAAWKWALLALATAVNVAAQGLLRYAFAKVQTPSGGWPGAGELGRLAATPAAWAGLSLQGAGFVLWLAVISRMELTYAFPLSGALFTLLMFVQGAYVLQEAVTPMRIAGAVLIVAGAALVGRSG
ncbi:MAG TPA: hypothetical protein P5137_00875 [Candidatus Brocadiia bacterium]|nr:hypothetical protein [Candidatus Brocadiia bacterium]